MALKLQTIIISTRPGRAGPAIAQWFHEHAKAHGKFDAQLVDLAEMKLPLYDEPQHPMRRQYEHEHTKKWAATVNAADAFAFVMPEYNFSPPPSFVNAIDYLLWEWQYKPAMFVTYAGVSGGTRSAQAARLQVTTVKMMPNSGRRRHPELLCAAQGRQVRRQRAQPAGRRRVTQRASQMVRGARASARRNSKSQIVGVSLTRGRRLGSRR